MADLSDAVAGIAKLVSSAFYPQGRPLYMPDGQDACSSPSAFAPSSIGRPVWVSRGWPLPASIDLAVGNAGAKRAKGVWISVFPQVNLTQVTSSVLRRWEEIEGPPATVAVLADDNAGTVAISGAGSPDVVQYVTVLIGRSTYTVPVAGDATPESIAAAIATAVAPDYPSAVAVGPVFMVDEGGTLIARVGRKGSIVGETERERQSIMTTIWAPDDEVRAQAGRLTRETLAATPRLRLADGSTANLYYRQTNDSDNFEKVGVYRRDIHYWVEFSTFIRVDGYEVTAPTDSVTLG